MKRVLGTFNTTKDKRYEFTTVHVAPGTRISGKCQWEQFKKRHHMTEDITLKEQIDAISSNRHETKKLERSREFVERTKRTLRRALAERRV